MIRRLYNWTMGLAERKNARLALFGVSFAESSFFPIPPDVLLIPMVLAQRSKAFALALWCTIASVLGGIAGYAIGHLLYDPVGLWLINLYGYGDKVEAFRGLYDSYGAWIVLTLGVTPIPYKLATIASGFAGYDLLLFVLFSFIARGFRFFGLAAILYYYGEPIRGFVERRLELLATLAFAVFVSGFVLVKYII
jgi:membrane protein YqaA with SNARE-associated domain